MSSSIRPISFAQHSASIGPHAPEASLRDPSRSATIRSADCRAPLERCSDGPIKYAAYLEQQNRTRAAQVTDRVELTSTSHASPDAAPSPRQPDVTHDASRTPETQIERLYQLAIPVPAGVTIDLFA